jgi:hypothetical protein
MRSNRDSSNDGTAIQEINNGSDDEWKFIILFISLLIEPIVVCIVYLKNNTTHILIPGDVGYNKSINYIKSRQNGVCYFCGKEITGGKDIIVSKLRSKTRYYHLECASRILII